MLQTQKTELKRELYNKDECFYFVDSLTGEINPLFQSIDTGLYNLLKRALNRGLGVIVLDDENKLLNSLYGGNKISLGGF